MNWLDYALIFIIILNFYNGLRYGFLRQAARLASFFLAFYVALFQHNNLKEFLLDNLDLGETITVLSPNGEAALWLTGVLSNIVAFLIIFITLSSLLSFLVSKLKFFNRIPVIGPLNAFLGSIFGIAKGVLLVILIAALISLLEKGFWMRAVEASAIVSLFRHYMPLFYGLIYDIVAAKLGILI